MKTFHTLFAGLLIQAPSNSSEKTTSIAPEKTAKSKVAPQLLPTQIQVFPCKKRERLSLMVVHPNESRLLYYDTGNYHIQWFCNGIKTGTCVMLQEVGSGAYTVLITEFVSGKQGTAAIQIRE